MTIMSFLALAWRSVMNRRSAALLTILSIALSVTLFLGVDKIRRSAESGFNATISGTDLIVGARSGSVNLLLYSVFRIGEATTNISWESYERYAARPEVAWTIPLSLGDSHKGYRVLGTTTDYFEFFRYGADRTLTFTAGEVFSEAHDTVIGSEVARSLGYRIGDHIIISHGVVSAGFADHEDSPFVVTGILAPTGTPVDRTVHISLEGLEHMHEGFAGAPSQAEEGPTQITAFLVGLNNRALALKLQRDINTDKQEALQAILPGIALAQLWQVVGSAELAFTAITGFVVIAGLLGLLATILTSLNERRREVAVLRATGASGGQIFSLLVLEATLLSAAGAILGAALVYGGLHLLSPVIETRFSVPLGSIGPGPYDIAIIAAVIGIAALLGCVPAWRAYRNALADGLTVKL